MTNACNFWTGRNQFVQYSVVPFNHTPWTVHDWADIQRQTTPMNNLQSLNNLIDRLEQKYTQAWGEHAQERIMSYNP